MSDGVYSIYYFNIPLFDEDGEYNYEIFVPEWILREIKVN